MDLQQYFSRIHYHGTPEVDFATLAQIHHQHLLHIPYENLDVQLARPLDLDSARFFEKLVTHQRGGWCYEMNGLLEWALKEIGFKVTRMSGAVMRASEGDKQLGNHLVLRVDLDQPYLADVGLGDGLREPIPIRAGTYQQGYLKHRLEFMEDGYWRFHNHIYSNVKSFDFKLEPAKEQELADKCQWLQTHPDSSFKKLFIAQRFTADSVVMQIGKVFSAITKSGKKSKEIGSAAELNAHMTSVFGLDEDFTPVWPQIEKAHERFFGALPEIPGEMP